MLILLSFIFVGVAIAVGIAHLMTRLLKVRIKFKGTIFIALLFLLCFSISSLLPRAKEDGVTIGRLGYPRRYEGSYLFYGFPAIMYRMFEPYDSSVRNLFLFPNNYYFIGFFVNFTFWLAISVILVYSVKSLLFSHHKDTGKKYDGGDREIKLKLQ